MEREEPSEGKMSDWEEFEGGAGRRTEEEGEEEKESKEAWDIEAAVFAPRRGACIRRSAKLKHDPAHFF